MAPDVPTLDLELATEIFSVATPDDAAMVRDIFVEFEKDVPGRFVRLRAADAPLTDDAMIRELHQLRGVVANFGMAAAASHVRTLEFEWRALAPAQRQHHLAAAEGE